MDTDVFLRGYHRFCGHHSRVDHPVMMVWDLASDMAFYHHGSDHLRKLASGKGAYRHGCLHPSFGRPVSDVHPIVWQDVQDFCVLLLFFLRQDVPVYPAYYFGFLCS